MPLKLSLKPGERLVLNGAVIANGDRRATLVVQNKAAILREREILQEEEANTPAKRIYFPVMMLYLDPANEDTYYSEFVVRMTEFMGVISNPDVLAVCVAISKEVMRKEYYRALGLIKKLYAYEEERLGHVSSGVSEDTAQHGVTAGQ